MAKQKHHSRSENVVDAMRYLKCGGEFTQSLISKAKCLAYSMHLARQSSCSKRKEHVKLGGAAWKIARLDMAQLAADLLLACPGARRRLFCLFPAKARGRCNEVRSFSNFPQGSQASPSIYLRVRECERNNQYREKRNGKLMLKPGFLLRRRA